MLWVFRDECLIIELDFSLWISLLWITLNSKKIYIYINMKEKMKKRWKGTVPKGLKETSTEEKSGKRNVLLSLHNENVYP